MSRQFFPDPRAANYRITTETDEFIILEDLGPWDTYKTITNAAEWVVEQLLPRLKGRKLYYVDTQGLLDQLVHDGERFINFKSGGPDGNQ